MEANLEIPETLIEFKDTFTVIIYSIITTSLAERIKKIKL